jgi:hypothetical protein
MAIEVNMTTIQGNIDSIYTKAVPIKRGPRAGQDGTVYHAMVNGYDVNLGFKCDFEEGELVTWNVEEKFGGWQLVKGGAPQAAASNSEPSTASKPNTGPITTGTAPTEFPVPKNTKGISICRQNSGGHAAVIVAALIKQGVIKDQAEAAQAFLELAYEITDFATGQREAAMADAKAAYKGPEGD